METKGSYQEELEPIARDGDQTELVYRGNSIHQLYLMLEKRQEASLSSVDEGPLDDENYLFKALCSLVFFGVHFVLVQGVFCSPRITIDSSFSRV